MVRFKEYFTESVKDQRFIVIYPGRFQPFHEGHYKTYSSLASKFGKDNVYIATSDKVEMPKSPFNFNEKQEIISTMFDINKNRIVKVKNPYIAIEITEKYPEDTVVIFAVGNKDADRLQVDEGKYFETYQDGEKMSGYKEHGYVYILSEQESTIEFEGNPISGTRVREVFSHGNIKEKKNLFKALYGKYDDRIFKLITGKIK